MPTSPEVLAIEEAHRAAQARLGVAGAFLALRDWSGVSVSAGASTSDAWLSRSLQMIRALSRKSVRLAKAYYQLARAVETGYSLGYPEYTSDPAEVTMGGLRKQFLDLVLEVADLDKAHSPDRNVSHVPGTSDPDEQWLEQELHTAMGETFDPNAPIDFNDTDLDSYIKDLLKATDSTTDKLPVKVDPYEWVAPDPTPEQVRAQHADELRVAANDRINKLRRIRADEALTAKQAFDKADKVHEAAGVINAGKVDMASIDPGRDILNLAMGRDKRVMMWARGTGPNPCAWCSMLASRGFAYTSKARASLTKGGTKGDQPGAAVRSYHENCHCFPIVRWLDIEDPTASGRSAHYEALWKAEMKGKRFASRGTKNDTLNHWRRLIYAERRAQALAEKAAKAPTPA